MSGLFDTSKLPAYPGTDKPDLRTKASRRWQKFLEVVTRNVPFTHWLSYYISWKTGKVVLYPHTELYYRASDFNAIRPIVPIPSWLAKLSKFQSVVSKHGEL